MDAMLPVLLFILALSSGDAKRDNALAPTFKMCEAHAALLEPADFVARALGKGHDCSVDKGEGPCCTKLRSLFGQGGDLADCLCNQEFYSHVLMGLPAKHGLHAEQYMHMLERCNVPFTGQPSCKGISHGSEPLVHKMDEENPGVFGRLFGGGSEPAAAPETAAPEAAPAPVNPNLVPYDRATQGNAYQPGGRYRPINQPAGFQPQQGFYPQPRGFYPQPQGFYPQQAPFYPPQQFPPPAGFGTQFPPPAGFPTQVTPQPPPAVPPVAPATAIAGGSPGSNPQDQVLQSNQEASSDVQREAVLSSDPPVGTISTESSDEEESPQEPPEETTQQTEESSNTGTEEPADAGQDESLDNGSEEPQENSGDGESSQSEEENNTDTAENPSEPTTSESDGQDTQEESNSNDSEDSAVDVTLDFVPKISGCTDIVAVASEIPNLSTLLEMVKKAGVLENVAGSDKVMTVLAPTNEAIGATLKAVGLTLDQLLDQPVFLKKILALHIIPGNAIRAADLSDGQAFKSLSGEDVTFSVIADLDFSVSVPSGVKSEILVKDLEACSSIVHVLSTMLLPELASSSDKDENSEDKSQSNDENDEGSSSNDGGEQTEDESSEGTDNDKSNDEEESTEETNVEAQAQTSEDGG